MVTSFPCRALAVRRVASSHGAKTPGVDNIVWNTPGQRFQAIEQLKTLVNKPNNYVASPVRRVWIDKPGKTEKRPLGIPTLIDRAAQAVYLQVMDPLVEEISDTNSYGFRRCRSAHKAITQLRVTLDKPCSAQ